MLMNSQHRRVQRVSALLLPIAIIVVGGAPARAQGKLEVDYAISFARIPIGSAQLAAEIGDEEYKIALQGRASGVARVLASGEGEFRTHGAVKVGELVPADFSSNISSSNEKLAVRMVLADGNVIELVASPMGEGRVPVSDNNRRGIIDPLTALLVSAGQSGGGTGEKACARRLPVFDGHRRYDLKLSFKREDKIKIGKEYTGPVVVCALEYQAISGHYPSEPLVKFLSAGRDMEVALAPAGGMHFLAPVRLSVAGALANLVIQATRFQAAPAPNVSNPDSRPQ
jgi:hypothetical protein